MKILRCVVRIIITYNILNLVISEDYKITLNKSNIVFFTTLYVAYKLY